MSFSEKFCQKTPFKNKTGGEYDSEMHKVASVPDKHALDLTGKYDKDYDELTDAVGYVDPDVTITTSTPKQPPLGGLKAENSDINMNSPANQTGYTGGGDVNAYYKSTAPYVREMQNQIAKAHNDYYDKKRGLYDYGKKNKNEIL